MFRVNQDAIITSPSDLAVAAECEFAFSRNVDALLGRCEPIAPEQDPMAQRAAELGDIHERQVLASYRNQGLDVVEIARPPRLTPNGIEQAVEATAQALRRGADVVFQGCFYDGQMIGFADFIVRESDGTYQVVDTKLARRAKVSALLQLASYADQLEKLEIAVAPQVLLILGDRSRSYHWLRDITPVYQMRKRRIIELIDRRQATDEITAWDGGDIHRCGHCQWCAIEVERTDHIIAVAGLSAGHRDALMSAGITTMTQLANVEQSVAGISPSVLPRLKDQARLQLASRTSKKPVYQVRQPHVVATLPVPSNGDIYFDFEGDPLYSEAAVQDAQGIAADRSSALPPCSSSEQTKMWGLDYLFGAVDTNHNFTALWADTLAEERQALIDFVAYVKQRRREYPDMHIYHYASYERTHLSSIAARHGVCEEDIDELLSSGVLVDLYPIVRRMLVIGAESYSLKVVEKLYTTQQERSDDVATAVDSVAAYWVYRDALAQGYDELARQVRNSITEYNKIDCISTARLHRWLLTLGADAGVEPGSADATQTLVATAGDSQTHEQLSHAAKSLLVLADKPHIAPRDRQALQLVSAGVDYHRREAKSFWWQHFSRLQEPIDTWADTRDVLVVESGRVVESWQAPEGRKRAYRRVIELCGTFGSGTTIKTGDSPFVVYDYDGPNFAVRSNPAYRPAHSTATILKIDTSLGYVLVEERRTQTPYDYDNLPVALTPGPPIRPGNMPGVIGSIADLIVTDNTLDIANPSIDILRRIPPRFRGRTRMRAAGDVTTIEQVVEAVRALDRSYLAIQGPPGTGKTYTGARVIAHLVNKYRWKIGVVAQSHAAVENMLHEVIAAGVSADNVGKKRSSSTFVQQSEELPWTTLLDKNMAEFIATRKRVVIGGTSWDFADWTRVLPGSLDLLVIDEAGQYSLATTLSSSLAAKNLLLLGDPQQLPQVSQGLHPAPIDNSALAHLSQGADVLPDGFGYFLAQTRRMSAPLTKVVSELSYAGRLTATGAALERKLLPGQFAPNVTEPASEDFLVGTPVSADRSVSGHKELDRSAGVHPVVVAHQGCSTQSSDEADKVREVITSLLGSMWQDRAGGQARALEQRDFIVVTPFNAQVELIRQVLDEARFPHVPVGTVDKFQGREAVISLISMTASSPHDVPRGMGFVLQRNRLNVAISRAQWASYVIYSPHLVDYLPSSPENMAELSAFLRIVTPR